MMCLVFSDLRDHATTWMGAFFIAVACGYLGGWAASMAATANTYPPIQSLAWTVVLFSSIAAVAVIVSAANLTVSAQRRSYALWQLVNIEPWLVSIVVLVQLIVVALLGALCGTLLEVVTFAPLFPYVFSSPFYQPIDQVVLEVGLSYMPVVWFAVGGIFLAGGLRGARSAGSTPPLTALRGVEPKHKAMSWSRALVFVGLGIGSFRLIAFMVESGLDEAIGVSLFLPLLVVATAASVPPLVFPVLMRAWTLLVPQKHWSAWYVARHAARYGLALSTSVEVPLMVGVGLVAGIFSLSGMLGVYVQQQGMIGWSTSLDWTSTILLLGGPIMLCSLGAAISVVMTSRSRARDVALLVVCGAQSQMLMVAAVCEAFIHAVTATLVGLAAAIVSHGIVAYAVDLPLFSSLAFGEALIVSLGGFVLILFATLVPTCAALGREPAALLSSE